MGLYTPHHLQLLNFPSCVCYFQIFSLWKLLSSFAIALLHCVWAVVFLHVYVCVLILQYKKIKIRKSFQLGKTSQESQWERENDGDTNWANESKRETGIDKWLKYCRSENKLINKVVVFCSGKPTVGWKKRIQKVRVEVLRRVLERLMEGNKHRSILSYFFLSVVLCQKHLNNTNHSFHIINEVQGEKNYKTPCLKSF